MSERRYSREDLGAALRDALAHVASDGWDRSPTLFGLVATADLARAQPGLVAADDESVLSPVVQEMPVVSATDGDDEGERYGRLERYLSTVSWPPTVAGAALVLEIVILPPEAEAELDSAFEPLLADPWAAEQAARDVANTYPSSRTARLAVGALREGGTLALMHLRPDPDEKAPGPDDEPPELLTHPELAPNLQAALAATFDQADPGEDGPGEG